MPATHPSGGLTESSAQSAPSSALSERQTAFTTALIKHPIFASFLAPDTPPLPLSPRLCISSTSSSLLFTLTPTSTLHCLNLAHLHSNPATQHITLTPSPPLPPASTTLFLSPSSTYLAVTSPHSCSIVKLPRSLAAASPPPSVACRSYGVGPLSVGSSAFSLLYAAFHPLSSHHLLMLLASASHSFALHLYNLTADLDQPELIIPLPSASSASRAVSFCFAGKGGWSAWSVYVLYDDGRISTVCPLLPTGVGIRRADVVQLREVEQAKVRRTGDEDAKVRLNWLSDTFGSGRADDADELVVSQSSSLRPLAGSAMDVGSSVMRGEGAVALIGLSASAVQLARVYGTGRVDVLAGVSEVQPRFVEGPLARAAEPTLAAVDTIALPASKPHTLLSLTSPASSSLAVLSPTGAHSLSFPYLSELAHVMSDPTLPSSALSSLLARLQTQLSSSSQYDNVIAGCVLADIALGRQLLILTTQGVHVLDLSKKLTLSDLRLASASTTAASPAQALSAAKSGAAFSAVLAPYLSKYRNFHIDLPATKQPLSLSSSASFAAFLTTLPQFQSTITDLHTLHGELTTRTTLLAHVASDTADALNTVLATLRLLRDKQQVLSERLALAAEIARETDGRVRRLDGEWRRRRGGQGAGGGEVLVSDAETQWRVEVEDGEKEARKEQRRVDEVTVRVAQLAALRERKRALQASEREAGGLQLGSVELGRLQAELSGQTRSIEELMADVRDIRLQVKAKEREDAKGLDEAGEVDQIRERNESKSNFFTPPLL